MNIFKVLASSKRGFPEEQASVMLAWLLNPYMEHGLGFAFLNKFLEKIDIEIKSDMTNFLKPVLRLEKNDEKIEFSIDIEYHVGNSFIDIVVFLNGFIFSIENKINGKAASNVSQLKDQYNGLKKAFDNKKIFTVFLVPNKKDPRVVSEFEKLEIKSESLDKKTMIEWEDIRNIIQKLLDEEDAGEITPMYDYLRHTLKAFSNFIYADDGEAFEGYSYSDSKHYGAKNEFAEDKREGLDNIRKNDKIGYVGVQHGLPGLLRYEKEKLQTDDFQVATVDKDMEYTPGWIKRELFVQICDAIINSNFQGIKWENYLKRLSSQTIYGIARFTPEKSDLFIGISGGANSLRAMDVDSIRSKKWEISTENTKNTSNWIDKKVFIDIIKEKEVFK
jgi:hypothetical protein